MNGDMQVARGSILGALLFGATWGAFAFLLPLVVAVFR